MFVNELERIVLEIGIGIIWSNASLISIPVLQSFSPSSSGIYGGILLTILGSGFSTNLSAIRIKVGVNICVLVQASANQLQCRVPSQGIQSSLVNISLITNGISLSTSTQFTYSTSNTPTVSSINPTWGGTGQVVIITGNNFIDNQTNVFIGQCECLITNLSSTSISCRLESGPAGVQAVLVQVASFGDSNQNIQFTYNLQVSSVVPSRGSYGGGQWIIVHGDGFNVSNINVTVCERPCSTISLISNTALRCLTPAAPYLLTDTTCSLKVTVDGLTQTVPFVYQTNLTAIITSVTPIRGGTGGDTTLTVNGTNFLSVSS